MSAAKGVKLFIMNETIRSHPAIDAAHKSMSENLTIATYNIGKHCQTLRLKGTEYPTVKRMIDAGAPKHGKYAAEFMAEIGVDLLGVQELVDGARFRDFMCDERHSRGGGLGEYGFHQRPKGPNYDAGIFYRTQKLGHVVHLAELSGGSLVRSAAAVYIPRFHLVFITVWLDHGKGKIKALESLDKSLRAALGHCPVERVVAVMDSNDFAGQELVGKHFTLLGKKLWHPGKSFGTCAEDCGFKGVGDFIFDSGKKVETLHIGVPTLPFGWTKYTQLMSDHLPVVATKTVNFMEKRRRSASRSRGRRSASRSRGPRCRSPSRGRRSRSRSRGR